MIRSLLIAHFRTLHGKLLVATVSQPGGTAPDAFVVVVNDQGQHALWQAELDLPPGWRCASAVLSTRECLAAIDGSWPDIAPASVRAAAGGAAGGGGGIGSSTSSSPSRLPGVPTRRP